MYKYILQLAQETVKVILYEEPPVGTILYIPEVPKVEITNIVPHADEDIIATLIVVPFNQLLYDITTGASRN